MYLVHSNLGMYAEEVVNRSISYYQSRGIAHIEKREIPIKIIKKISVDTVLAKLLSKSSIDYFGHIKGKYIEFEVKESNSDEFNLSNIKKHQFEYMEKLVEEKIYPFILLYMSKYEKFIKIDFSMLNDLIKHKKIKNKVVFSDLEQYFTTLSIEYPGIINFLNI